jgi:hypothetical protein
LNPKVGDVLYIKTTGEPVYVDKLAINDVPGVIGVVRPVQTRDKGIIHQVEVLSLDMVETLEDSVRRNVAREKLQADLLFGAQKELNASDIPTELIPRDN